jgi:hypothetical protein
MGLVQNKELYTRISKILNHTFGTTGPGSTGMSSVKVNLKALDDGFIHAKYISTVTFTSDKNLDALMRKFRNEGYAYIEDALKNVSKEYKNQLESEKKSKVETQDATTNIVSSKSSKNTTENNISFEIKTDTATENVEYLHYNIYNTTKRAFYKMSVLIEIKD